MALELSLLVFVRSLRQSSFSMNLDALTELVPWFFALDHTHYARWIPVHLRDMSDLPARHPDIAREFNAGNFTIQKTNRVFSAIAVDQAHEQNNAWVKSAGGAIGLTENASALRRWMVAGPEVATLSEDFENAHQLMRRGHEVLHHDQIASARKAFRKDVSSLVSVIEEMGNPFEEESTDLIVLHSKEIAHPLAVETVKKAQKIGQQQFEAFTKESHEEADSRMLLHVSHAAKHGHHHILIRTVETDVVVLAVFAISQLPAGCELWLAFGTGYDTVSSFARHGKKAAWCTWKSLPELTDALLMLNQHLHQGERCKKEALSTENLNAANTTYLSCSCGTCQESSLPGQSHLGEDTATRPCASITN
ncbi:hypothetical protein ABVT39_020295 [Epinephelus coioides]